MTWNDGDALTPANLNQKGNRPVFNVKEFGAVGDGSTDDLSAFKNARDDAADNNGIVVMDGSTFRLNGELSWKTDVPLVGVNRIASKLEFSHSGSAGLLIPDGASGWSLSGFEITETSGASTTSLLELAGNNSHFFVHDLLLRSGSGDGVEFSGGTIFLGRWNDVEVNSAGEIGWRLRPGSGWNNQRFTECYANGCSGDGWDIRDCTQNGVWVNCAADKNAFGWRFGSVVRGRIVSSVAEQNNNDSFVLASSGKLVLEETRSIGPGGTAYSISGDADHDLRHPVADSTGGSNSITAGSGATGVNRIQDPDLDSGTFFNSSAVVLENGVGEESANAEEPQLDWPIGAIVGFTDSGDGTGTGQYLLLPDGSTWVQIN